MSARGSNAALSDEALFLMAIGKAPADFDWTKIAPEDRGQWARRALEWIAAEAKAERLAEAQLERTER